MMRFRLTLRHQALFALLLLFIMSSVWGWVQTRRVYFEYITDIQTIQQQRSGNVTVTTTSTDTRTVAIVSEMEGLLERGFDALNLWQADASVLYWEQFFSGPAQRAIEDDAACGADANYVITGTLAVDFLQDDFSLAILRGTLDVVHVNPDNPAVLRHDVRVVIEQKELGWNIAQIDDLGRADLPRQVATVSDIPLNGFNYYPIATPWSLFWPNFNPAETEQDFAGMKALGANSVRIFLTEAAFRDPNPENEAALVKILDIAVAQDMAVIVTLFDLKTGYGFDKLLIDLQTLDRVLAILNDSPARIVVDLKNEPDLDYEGHANARNWIAAIASSAREKTALPLTIGWSHADYAEDFADWLDIISYHDYAPVDGTQARLDAVRAAANGKPVVVSEIGAASLSLWLGYPSSGDKQARQIRQRLDGLQGTNGVLVWNYNDFTEIDHNAVGHNFWTHMLQSTYGIIDFEGRLKPAADAVTSFWAGGSPPVSQETPPEALE
ncbi:glycoside hydrolase family 5 protein [Octadecabacter sp.]|nr:glycoside hydrolase family 5 protein [Octadecabacter sp.]MDC1381202.1 glycoside hydrolase family 5 protein [Octadecabacter sp.]